MCFAKCTGSYSPPTWFNACRDNKIDIFNEMLDEYSQNRDTRHFQITNKKGELDFSFPTYTGLMYAVIFNNEEIALQLIDEEQDLFTQAEVLVPTLTEVSMIKFQINDLVQYNAYKQRNMKNFTLIPRSSSILDICLLVGNIRMYFVLAQRMERQYVYHVNYSSKNNLMYLIELQDYFELQPLSEDTQLFYYFMFQRQSLALSKTYENVINQCLKYGNYIILEIVLSLFGKKYQKIYKDFIDTAIIYQQFKKEQLIYLRKKQIIEELKRLEDINYMPMIEQNDQQEYMGDNNNIDLDQTQGPVQDKTQQLSNDQNQENIEKTNFIKKLETELSELDNISLKTLNLSSNQLQCIMLIKNYEAGIIQQQFDDAQAVEEANIPEELRQQLGNSSQLSETPSQLETIQEDHDEPALQVANEQQQELSYYQQENKQVDNSLITNEKKIVRSTQSLVNPMQKIKLSRFEQFTKKKKFSQLYTQKLGDADVYKVNTFGQNSINFGAQSESESKENLVGSIFNNINCSETDKDYMNLQEEKAVNHQENDVTDI